MKLSEMACGVSAVVSDLSALPAATRKKLMVMGVLPKTELSVVRIAPMGDPLQVRVRGVDIALRKQIAANIDVEVR
ncbi:FeoA family protein [Photobacterium sanguinicancri]|uniref:FeoA family protein n=1 Tax=Photobacterium sanguinicancri TaxID=875932 RepID=UPI0026E46435|nr:FeoA family protein [Photobacterium sanguinicancri]MDO6497433.1 FeoA family protein [Photobacterium sanguinicancri]